MINTDGILVNAIPDKCQNYKPIPGSYSGVSSQKLGKIYNCENYQIEKYPQLRDIKGNACLHCHNWQKPDKSYPNR